MNVSSEMVIGSTTSAKVVKTNQGEMFMNTAIIPFNSAELVTAKDENGKIYVAMKPIVEAMGLEWARQNQKISEDERYVHMSIPFQTAGGMQEMTCLPLDQLAGWLYSINPNKVKAEVKQTVISFQQETFNVINAYWMGETVSRQSSMSQMEVLAQIVNRMVEIERQEARVLELSYNLEKEHKRVNKLEHNIRRTITDNDHFTVIAYASLNGIDQSSYNPSVLGKKATSLSKERGYIVTSLPESRYGKVNVYHKEILQQIFEELQATSA